MNAPTAAAALVEQSYELLPLTSIALSETPAQVRRRKRYTAEAIAEFAVNIRAVGVMEPVIVRKLTALRGLANYELIAGERRLLAATEAGFAHIPAMVRDNIADAALALFQLSENIQRESTSPLEEAEALRDIMDSMKIDAEAAGNLIGRGRRVVFNRLKLLDIKHIAVMDALESGRLDSGKAVQIARYPSMRVQLKALELIGDETVSQRAAAEILRDKLLVRLDDVPFDLEDDSFATSKPGQFASQQPNQTLMPACTRCEHCSSNDPEMNEQVIAWYGESARACTDKPCHDFKVKTFFEHRIHRAKNLGRRVIEGDEAKLIKQWPHAETLRGWVDLDAPCDEMETPAGAGDDWEPPSYREVLGAPDAMNSIALLIDPFNKQPREIAPQKDMAKALKAVGIKLAAQAVQAPAPADLAAAQGVKNDTATADKRTDARDEERREAERQSAREDQERLFRRRLLQVVHGKWKGPMKRDDLQAACDHLMGNGEYPEFVDELYGQQEIKTERMKEQDLSRLLFALTVGMCVDFLGDSPNVLLAAAKRFKIDQAKVRKQVKAELGGTPEPEPKAKKAKKKKKASK